MPLEVGVILMSMGVQKFAQFIAKFIQHRAEGDVQHLARIKLIEQDQQFSIG